MQEALTDRSAVTLEQLVVRLKSSIWTCHGLLVSLTVSDETERGSDLCTFH